MAYDKMVTDIWFVYYDILFYSLVKTATKQIASTSMQLRKHLRYGSYRVVGKANKATY